MKHQSRFSQEQLNPEETASAPAEWAREMIDTQPIACVSTMFFAGFAIGVGIVAALAASSPPPQTRRFSSWPSTEEWGRRFSDSVSQVVPRQVSDLWSRS